ncbi:MAG: YesL family protein [Oscillospiraceae bacterium]|nr:YesL family protein [Oscillospiraceae bacterium]
MGLFNNTAGPGVPKNAPRKKPFFRFWELFANKFWDFFKINLIYFLFCIPIVTIGPATAAMTALMRNIYLERPQFYFHDFVKEFKKNFKQALIVGILDILVTAVFVFSLVLFFSLEKTTDTDAVVFALSAAAAVLFFIMNFYIYPQIVALDLKLLDIFRNALVLSLLNIWAELIVLVFSAGYIFLAVNYPVFVLPLAPFVPLAWLGFLSVFCCYPAIQKHIINPYYKQTGEKNPEIPDYAEQAIFTDMGGSEKPVDLKKGSRQSKGKIIK